MDNVGKIISNFYCNGFGGRRYDLAGSIIEAEEEDWIVIRTDENEPVFMNFLNNKEKNEYIAQWTN